MKQNKPQSDQMWTSYSATSSRHHTPLAFVDVLRKKKNSNSGAQLITLSASNLDPKDLDATTSVCLCQDMK